MNQVVDFIKKYKIQIIVLSIGPILMLFKAIGFTRLIFIVFCSMYLLFLYFEPIDLIKKKKYGLIFFWNLFLAFLYGVGLMSSYFIFLSNNYNLKFSYLFLFSTLLTYWFVSLVRGIVNFRKDKRAINFIINSLSFLVVFYMNFPFFLGPYFMVEQEMVIDRIDEIKGIEYLRKNSTNKNTLDQTMSNLVIKEIEGQKVKRYKGADHMNNLRMEANVFPQIIIDFRSEQSSEDYKLVCFKNGKYFITKRDMEAHQDYYYNVKLSEDMINKILSSCKEQNAKGFPYK